ncbi:MAG: pilus assembly protein PilP [Candidatus Tectomicrobia bacterium]|nr:pilus assembly protein PilP [Candidatus Tectomicrobia bacterium]
MSAGRRRPAVLWRAGGILAGLLVLLVGAPLPPGILQSAPFVSSEMQRALAGAAAAQSARPAAPAPTSKPPAEAPRAPQAGGAATAAAPAIIKSEPGELRDPFKPLILSREELARREKVEAAKKAEEPAMPTELLPPLQRFDLSNLTLVGIIRAAGENLAVVQAPNGRGYFVRAKMRVGRNQGVVKVIRPDSIVIVEQHKNPLGQPEPKEVTVKLRPSEG